MKYFKYIIFFILWLALFYGLFAIDGASFNPFAWNEITRLHFAIYAGLINIVLTAGYYIKNNFK